MIFIKIIGSRGGKDMCAGVPGVCEMCSNQKQTNGLHLAYK